MPIQKITEINSPPIAGNFYLVPCVQVPMWTRIILTGNFRSGDWVPILEPIHEDKEIGFSIEHYHYDLRFCKQQINPTYVVAIDQICFPTKKTEIVYKRRKCQHHSPRSFRQEGREITEILEISHANKKLQDWICPHKQTLLKNCLIDSVDFCVVCPSHGLKWCTKSGNLIKYKN